MQGNTVNVQVGSSAAASMDISPLIEAFEGMMGSVPQLQQLFSQAGAQAARPAEAAAPTAAAAAAPVPAAADAQSTPHSTSSAQPAGTASSVHEVLPHHRLLRCAAHALQQHKP